ncbi:MAG: adenosylcobalamin-dependent ribonucleoside-diphosphate reductase, partial [Candidatus Woesearchaeota archaeon]|nr:adenosylcobalamin-dependent ribonucleoside-diphosphate reductase [Candidatus Woesearchaeota archaeon]
ANIAILNVDHPDIIEFINAKRNGLFNNFNISVAVTDKFMEAVKKNRYFELRNPQTRKVERRIRARRIFNEIVKNAWERGDPGIIFIDEINRKNPLKLGKIEATNPCGEQPLYPYESCNLGSVNLSNMVKDGKIDWNRLKKTIHSAVHFLDNVIDVNKFPLPEIEKATKASRKIGLGVMGFAEFLIKLDISYNSEEAIKTAEKLMRFITMEARKKSEILGKERGSFPNFKKSRLYGKYKAMRNATVTTIAPTGTISIIAGTSSGIEPLFSLVFTRRILGGKEFKEVNKLYAAALKKGRLTKKQKKVFVTAMEIEPEYHIRMQAAFQKYTDNAVSKTVNLPTGATINKVKNIFMLAYDLKCKGITIYRYGSKEQQVLNVCKECI